MRSRSGIGIISSLFLCWLFGTASFAGEGVPPPPSPRSNVAPGVAVPGTAQASPSAESETTMGLVIQKVAPSIVISDEPFTYRILVRNTSSTRLENVIITDNMPVNFQPTSTNPQPAEIQDRRLRWVIPAIDRGQAITITIEGKPTSPGMLEFPGTATATVPHLIRITSVKPALQLTKTAPAEALLGDTFVYGFTITNTGTGTATNVRVQDELPEGIVTLNNERAVVFDVGVLAQGQSRQFELQVRSVTTGEKINIARAVGDPRLSAEARATTIIRKAELVIKKVATSRTYLNQPIVYKLQVRNIGDATAIDTVIVDPVPPSTTFRGASDGGVMNEGRVVWRIGNLPPGGQKDVEFHVIANQIGEVRNVAQAQAKNAPPVQDAAITIVEGLAALRLECVDTVDPVMVGEETEYIIDATNTGTANAHNVRIVVTLEDSMAYLNSAGPTAATQDGATIAFAPLPVLRAQDKQTWRVKIRAVKPSDARFTIRMFADELTRAPVAETESTTIYGD